MVDGDLVVFLIILDKGYRITQIAYKHGEQLVLQPDLRRSDRAFTRLETIGSACIATHRSGNERQVNRSKLSEEVRRGLAQNGDFVRLDDAWLAWNFRVNFMILYIKIHLFGYAIIQRSN